MSVAKVILDLNTPSLRRTYDYLIPESLRDQIELGSTVIIPVRRRERLGYVVGIEKKSSAPCLKPIGAVVAGNRLIGPIQITLSRWMADYYLTGLSETLKLALPPGTRHHLQEMVEVKTKTVIEEPAIAWLNNKHGSAPRRQLEAVFGRQYVDKLLKKDLLKRSFLLLEPSVKPKTVEFADVDPSASLERLRGQKQKAILSDLFRKSPQPVKELLLNHKAGRSTLNTLVNNKMISLFKRREERQADTDFTKQPAKTITLNDEQNEAAKTIITALRSNKKKTILLEGVTGSGKTEIYIRGAEACLASGRSSMILVPEIALLPQLVERLSVRFGQRLAVLHSGLKATERFDAWHAVASGRKKIIVGARSALFAPANNIGLIVLDEEHETSYKQNTSPRYDARVVAGKLAELHQAVLLMGSATPSLEAQRSTQLEGIHVKLNHRVAGFNLPSIKIVDMRQEFKSSRYGLLSRTLIDSLTRTLDSGHKAILLINRRGFANFLLCRKCGYVPNCPNCSVSLTFHRVDDRLRCHHCDSTSTAPDLCPECRSTKWRYSGAGTQRVESDLKEIFKDTAVIRMDSDTTSRRGSHRDQLISFYNEKRAILLGTQMIAKGLDFPEVALVGIVSADTALNLPDFRAAERTAQLLKQVSGRSGRGPVPGEVIIQTFNPENYAIQAARSNYDEFCRVEIEHRRSLGYPPFSSIINIILSSKSQDRATIRANELAEQLRGLLQANAQILGPSPAPIQKVRGYWRWHLMIMTSEPERVKSILKKDDRLTRGSVGVKIIIDIDPIWLM